MDGCCCCPTPVSVVHDGNCVCVCCGLLIFTNLSFAHYQWEASVGARDFCSAPAPALVRLQPDMTTLLLSIPSENQSNQINAQLQWTFYYAAINTIDRKDVAFDDRTIQKIGIISRNATYSSKRNNIYYNRSENMNEYCWMAMVPHHFTPLLQF